VKSMRGLLVTMLLLTTPAALAGEEILAQRSDRYDVQWGDISLGEGVVSLKLLEGNCYRYESQTHPIALVRWTYGSPRETSEFCIENGEVHSRRFEFKNDKRSKDSFTLEFDWKLKQVKLIQGGTVTVRDLPGLAYDRFVIREAVRLWVKHLPDAAGRPEQTFTMIDEDRVRSYRFAVTGKERISTPAGEFETVRVERVDNPKKSYRYWLAPSRDYVPVKIEHINKGKVELRMDLLGAG
jgi:hypothetical protein